MANNHNPSPDSITIHQLKVDAAVGILAWEKTERQTLLLDCHFSINAATIAKHDDIKKTVDYASIRETILNWALTHRVNLIETFADQLANFLLDHFPLTEIQLTIKKPAIFPDAQGVSVTITRTGSNDTAR